MNKYRLRAFSFGIIFAVAVIGTNYFFFTESTQANVAPPTIAEAKKIVTDHQLVVLTKEELTAFEQAAEQLKTLEEQQKKKSAKDKKQEKQIKKYTLQVKTGMTSDDIARLLKEAQVIDSERDFIDYMAINGYSKSIQLGSFQITDEMSYEKIAKTICEVK